MSAHIVIRECARLEHMPSCFMYMCGYLVLGECPHSYTCECMHVIESQCPKCMCNVCDVGMMDKHQTTTIPKENQD